MTESSGHYVVQVHIEVDRVKFSDRKTTVELAAVIQLGAAKRSWFSGERRPITGFGATPTHPGTEHIVPLFAHAPQPADIAAEKILHLSLLFRYGMEEIIRAHTFKVKPLVRVSGIAQFNERTAGYGRALVTHALLDSGAKEVEFVE